MRKAIKILAQEARKPKILYKGFEGGFPNINRFAFGEHYAEDIELAKEFGKTPLHVKKVIVNPNAKIVDIDPIKIEYAKAGKLADPQEITRELKAQGYDIAVGTMSGGKKEYVVLNDDAVQPFTKLKWATSDEFPFSSKSGPFEVIDAEGDICLFEGGKELGKFRTEQEAMDYCDFYLHSSSSPTATTPRSE